MFEGISLIGGSNFLTIVAEVGTGGLASPIVIPLDIAATAAGANLLRMVDLFGINRFKMLRILFKNPVFWWGKGTGVDGQGASVAGNIGKMIN